MVSYERLKDIIDDILAWGSEHEDEFREDLIYASGITKEEFQELFHEDIDSYIYDGEECEEEEED